MNDNHADEGNRSGMGTPSLAPDELQESDALEELLRHETLRHLDAAWAAYRRLLMTCLPSLQQPTAPGNDSESRPY
jgi:hypothetical protein